MHKLVFNSFVCLCNKLYLLSESPHHAISFFLQNENHKNFEIEESNNWSRSFVSKANNGFAPMNIVKCRYFHLFMAPRNFFWFHLMV